jgi:phosphoribosylformylglycinamidine cyclo-ligase
MVSYSDAGVNIEKGNKISQKIKKHVESTFNENVLLNAGLFAGAINLKKLKFKDAVLLASIDGVGTKTVIAKEMNSWNTIGEDLVNHSVNDLLCHGAKPIAFLDYIASSSLKPEIVEEIVKGISTACKKNDIALIGGETAEMPGIYQKNEVDVAGTIIGITEKNKMITGKKIKEKDALIGLPSNGLHTNGYSLARKVIKETEISLHEHFIELNSTIGKELMKVHKSYLKEIQHLMKKFELKGIAHITGGGLIYNIPRILPKGIAAKIFKERINPPFIFKWIQEKGNIQEKEMLKTFNMGIGMVLVVEEKDAEKIIEELKNEFKLNAVILGETTKGKGIQLIEPSLKI